MNRTSKLEDKFSESLDLIYSKQGNHSIRNVKLLPIMTKKTNAFSQKAMPKIHLKLQTLKMQLVLRNILLKLTLQIKYIVRSF